MNIFFRTRKKKPIKIPIICQFCKQYWCVQFSIEQFRVWFEKKCMKLILRMYHYEYVFDILSFDNLLKVISVTFWSLKLNTVIFRSYFLITYLKSFSLKGMCMYYCSSLICAFVQYLIFAHKKLLYKKTLNYIW